VHWLPIEAQFMRAMLGAYLIELDLERNGIASSGSILETVGFNDLYATYTGFLEQLRRSGLDRYVKHCWKPLEDLEQITSEPKVTPDELISRTVVSAMQECRVFVDSRTSCVPLEPYWSTDRAASDLFQAMSALLLPDVSDLPLEGIADMRDKLNPTLDPMRAEILRFTEDLRRSINDQLLTPSLLAAEARNLIATRVEPVVREAHHRTREMAQNKFRKLFANAAEAFGFAGAAFIDPKMIAKAVKKTLETGALAFADAEDDVAQPRATAQFLLQAHTLIPELRASYTDR
jgi:hypothetical protein